MNQSSFKVTIQGRTITLEKKTKILDLIEGNKKIIFTVKLITF